MSAVHIVGLFAQQIEKLRIGHRHQKIKRVISVRYDDEQGCLPVTQRIQRQFIVGRQVPQFLNIERG